MIIINLAFTSFSGSILYLNLFHSWFVESQVKAVVDKRPHFLVVAIVTDAYDRNPCLFDQLNQLLQTETRKKIFFWSLMQCSKLLH